MDMGPILIVLWLLALPIALMAAGYLGALALGRAFSTGEDGDPPDLSPGR